MKKIILLGAILCSCLIAVVAISMNSQGELAPELTAVESSEMPPYCRKFTDPCPDGTVGFHCAMSTNLSIPLCRLNAVGQCAQIWPCGTASGE